MLISELAENSGVSVSTIRRYLKRGLLEKPETTTFGWRMFTEKHVDQLRKLMGRSPGLNNVAETLARDIRRTIEQVIKSTNRSLVGEAASQCGPFKSIAGKNKKAG